MTLLYRWLYTSFAWAYDGIAALVSVGRWKDWVLAILPYASASPILELGCGPGHLQAALLERSGDVYGLDISPQMCRLAGHRLLRRGFRPKIMRGSAEHCPFPNEFFACLLATFPAPYIFTPATVREVHRLLQPGGSLIVLLAVQLNGDTLPERILRLVYIWTGEQAPDDGTIGQLLKPYQDAGFTLALHWQAHGPDHLLMAFIEKSRLS